MEIEEYYNISRKGNYAYIHDQNGGQSGIGIEGDDRVRQKKKERQNVGEIQGSVEG